MKILIVDDNKENLYLLETLLKGNGYKVISATNGAEALEKLRANNFDMIVSDILMPVMDGFQLCHKCKKDENLKAIPFVFYTATYVDERDEKLALKLGADRFIRKPIEPDEFITIIRGVIRDVEAGKLARRKPVAKEEGDILKLYSERLVKKLERKMLDLEAEVARRKQAEEALRQSEEQYRLITENARDVIITTDMNLRLTYVSPSVRYLGTRTAEEVMATSLEELLTPASLEDATKVFIEELEIAKRQPRDPDRSRTMELEIMRRGDSTIWTEAKINFLRGAEDQPLGIIAVLRDITERKKAAEVIEKQREEYRTIFDAVRPMIAYLDRDGTVMRINKAGASVFGLEPKEIIRKTMYDLFSPDEAETFTRQNMEVISSGKPLLGTVTQYTRPSGEKRWAQVDTLPYRDEHDQIIGVIQFNQDITRRKLAEENLERSLAALRKTLLDTIAAMAAIVEMKDPYTAGHQVRVAQVAVAIAEEMNLPDEQINSIRAASTIHDVGKIYVPAEILNKPGKLSEIEFGMIKTHVQGSYDILKNIDFPWPIAQITLQHHERLDGSGYPKGLRGEEMLLEAKILAVSDVVEAMASHRPYRPALGLDKALEEISQKKDILYDAEAVEACIRLFHEKGFNFDA